MFVFGALNAVVLFAHRSGGGAVRSGEARDARSLARGAVGSGRCALRIAGATRRLARELLEVATWLGRGTVHVRSALRTTTAHASRRAGWAVGVDDARGAPFSRRVAERSRRAAVRVRQAADAGLRERIAEPRPIRAAVPVGIARRVAAIVARPAGRRGGAAIGIGAARAAAALDAELLARAALDVGQAFDASERGVAFAAAARAPLAGESAGRDGIPLASTGHDDETDDAQPIRKSKHPAIVRVRRERYHGVNARRCAGTCDGANQRRSIALEESAERGLGRARQRTILSPPSMEVFCSAMSATRPKTSIDILRERDTFRARVLELEAVLAQVRRETDEALRKPQAQFLVLCRIATVVYRALDREAPAPPASGPKAIHKARS